MAQRTATYLVGTATGDINKQDVTVTGDTSTSGTNGMKLADYRFDDGGLQRTVFGTLTSGAHLNLYVYPFPGDTTTKHLETVVSAGSSSFTTATNSFSEVVNGPFYALEGVKVCAGTAAVIAYL